MVCSVLESQGAKRGSTALASLLFTILMASACGPEPIVGATESTGESTSDTDDASASTTEAATTTETATTTTTETATTTTTETATTEGPALPCGPLELPPLDTDYALSWCIDGAWDPDPIIITNEADWLARVSGCSAQTLGDLPVIDWDASDVVGAAGSADCPWRGGYMVTEASHCDGVITIESSVSSDLCYCDYNQSFVHLYVVPAGSVETVNVVVTPLATCEEVTCDCGGGEQANACDGCPFPP